MAASLACFVRSRAASARQSGPRHSNPWGASRARLQLARALDLSGEKSKAKAAYQEFLTLWKDADQDIPILKQAKAEFARLQSPIPAGEVAKVSWEH